MQRYLAERLRKGETVVGPILGADYPSCVVEILAGGTAFEIEFSDREGRTYESLGLRPE